MPASRPAVGARDGVASGSLMISWVDRSHASDDISNNASDDASDNVNDDDVNDDTGGAVGDAHVDDTELGTHGEGIPTAGM